MVLLPEFPLAADLMLGLAAVAVVIWAKRGGPFVVRLFSDAGVRLVALNAACADVRGLGLLAADAARFGADEREKGWIKLARTALHM